MLQLNLSILKKTWVPFSISVCKTIEEWELYLAAAFKLCKLFSLFLVDTFSRERQRHSRNTGQQKLMLLQNLNKKRKRFWEIRRRRQRHGDGE